MVEMKPFEHILEMNYFVDEHFNLIESIKFLNARNEFPESLANDLTKINSSSNIYVFADKIRNIYDTPRNITTRLCTTT